MSAETFVRDAVRTFRFVRVGFDPASGEVRLVYSFDAGPELVETILIPGAPFLLEGARAEAVQQALQLLHLIAGVSYYKAAVPEELRIESYAIDAATAEFLTDVYENGLGEFAYRNGLSLRGRIRFPAFQPSSQPCPGGSKVGGADADDFRPDVAQREHHPLPNPPLEGEGDDVVEGARRALVAIGGGKDSLVSIELLRAAGVSQGVAWIGSSPLIRACAERTGLPTVSIARQIAPPLFEFNRQGAWNGHIPVTAVNSAILVLAALLHGVDQVVFSNERSASYGSLIRSEDGQSTTEVNHQWSKGWAFESAFGGHLQRHLAADLQYYSLLRPLSELAVARQKSSAVNPRASSSATASASPIASAAVVLLVGARSSGQASAGTLTSRCTSPSRASVEPGRPVIVTSLLPWRLSTGSSISSSSDSPE
jgi:hypothetical protein